MVKKRIPDFWEICQQRYQARSMHKRSNSESSLFLCETQRLGRIKSKARPFSLSGVPPRLEGGNPLPKRFHLFPSGGSLLRLSCRRIGYWRALDG
jgi:hypothetical protein